MKILSLTFYTIAMLLFLGMITVPTIGILTGYWLLEVTGTQTIYLLMGTAGYVVLGTVFQLLHLEIEYKKNCPCYTLYKNALVICKNVW